MLAECENASRKSNLFMGMWINKLQPMRAVTSSGQMGQHSPDVMIGLAHSLTSSQIISSHRTDPLSHTQIRHGSGFHTSLSLYGRPSWMQPPASSAAAGRGRTSGGQRKKRNEKTDRLFPWRHAKQGEGLQGGWLSADVRSFLDKLRK